MPRNTTRSRTIREEVPLIGNVASPQLTAARRFFTSKGNNRANRGARALAEAFDVGTDFLSSKIDRDNRLGAEAAVTSRASGAERDEDNENAGFNIMWDKLDAESDLNLIKHDLPIKLEDASAEDMTERQVKAFISDSMKELFDGIDLESAYALALAPGLLELEETLLGVHRDQQLEKNQLEYRSKINLNLKERFLASVTPENKLGTFPYDYLMEQTDNFFDGETKKLVFWETVWDFAVRNGRPDIITNTPERFPNQDPTGIDDPFMADDHRAMIRAALVKAGSMAEDAQDDEDAINAAKRLNLQYEIFQVRQDGGDVSELLRQLKLVPGTTLGDITSAKNFADGQLSENESRSADLEVLAPLWLRVHSGAAGIEEIFNNWNFGLMGNGTQANKLFRDMMSTARQVQGNLASLATADANEWRTVLNNRFNAKTDGISKAINPVMHRINIEANAFFNVQVASGVSGVDAYNAASDRFDPSVKNLPQIEPLEIIGRRGQDEFVSRDLVTLKLLRLVADGEISYGATFSGINPRIISDRLVEELKAGNLTENQVAEILYESQ